MTLLRREFLKVLTALPIAGLAQVQQRDRRVTYLLNECLIAGFRFHDGPAMIESMRVGDAVALQAQPDNPHDAFAVALSFRGRPIGYLPRDQNEPVSRLLRQSAPVDCRIRSVRPDAKPWRAVTVQVSITVDLPADASSR